MAFTPDQRVSASDPVLRVKGHVTSSIVLADDGEYALGSRATALASVLASPVLIKSNLNGRYRVSLDSNLDDDFDSSMEFQVRDMATVIPTGWAVSTNVANLVLPAGHGLVAGQWIKVGGFATAPAAVGNATTPAVVLITSVDADGLGVNYAATTGDASATENGTVDVSRVSMAKAQAEVIYDSALPDEATVSIGALRRGRYIVSTPGATSTNGFAAYASDGTALVIETPVTTTDIALNFDDADTAAMTNLTTSGGAVILNSNNGALRVRVEFQPDNFAAADVDGYVCLFEKDGDLILRNRLGSSQTLSIERL